MHTEIRHHLDQILCDIAGTGCRAAFVCHVENEDILSGILQVLDSFEEKRMLVVSNILPLAVKPISVATILGREIDMLIYDARDAFNPDVLGVVSGALVGDGLLVLLLPPKKQWQASSKPFTEHFKSLLSAEGVCYFDEVSVAKKNSIGQCQKVLHKSYYEEPFKTHDQMLAVETIIEDIQSHNDNCIVLTSGRGRGKSSALGIVATRLLQKGNYRVFVTAPRLSVADPIYAQLQRLCSDGYKKQSEFICNESVVKFIAPDALLDSLPEADLLLIDEAAAIPLPMLEKLLKHYNNLLFSTTTHGYEGTGRGFVIKFCRLLDKLRPQWKSLRLHQPIRWSTTDPLEKWIEKLLFLNVRLADAQGFVPSMDELTVGRVTSQELLSDESRRSEVFSLLVFAHYRTRPSDFQYLLDDETVRVYLLEYQQRVLGVLMISQEGDFDERLSSSIYKGERRPRGHLLAQTLCFHAGVESAAQLSYGRIMRIAIHPELQGNGLGSYFLGQVIDAEKQYDLDVLGSSFSANVELLKFWNKAGMQVLRFGFSRDHVSASYSAVVGMPLSDSGEGLVESLQIKFKRNYQVWRAAGLSGLNQDINEYILKQGVLDIDEFTEEDFKDVVSFARYKRNFDPCYPAIVRMLQNSSLMDKIEITEKQKHIIDAVLCNKNNWKKTVKAISATGRADAELQFKQCLLSILNSIESDR